MMSCIYCHGKFKGMICSDWCVEQWQQDNILQNPTKEKVE